MKKVKDIINYFFVGIKTLIIDYLPLIVTVTFFLVLIIVIKAINTKKQLTEYKVNETKIIQKLENNIKIEYPEDTNSKETKGASSIVKCLKEPLTKQELTEKMLDISKKLENIMNESNYNFAFKYKDIYTGFSLSYNSSQPIFAASTIKAPEAIYIYEEAEKGNINLNDTITYTAGYYSEGTGILKNKNFNTDYSIRDLVGYSIIHSDNAAHLMLNNKYKPVNINAFWSNLGTTTIYKNNDAWGNINANDATIYMTELYNYVQGNSEYSKELLKYFEKSWKVISIPDKNIKIANKSGWSDTALHDTALILDENPYTLIILSNRGYVEYQSFFDKISNLTYEFHKEYWTQKTNTCIKTSE